jgi:predicted RNA binding protein YcfA (HicA-like mRNA interferase family)
MKAISGKKLAKIVEKRGWILKKITGSHHIYMKDGFNVRLSIPIHGNESLKIGLQSHLMKMAGLTESDL